ncbi:13600_t:CDS:2 [Entrophospora sp. SA101]|nr:13600_t:CDS:2 [Entrophospora sp. SA101]
MDENVKYLYPNDEEEIERLENQYYLLKEKWNATFLSPVAPKLLAGGKVLDIGIVYNKGPVIQRLDASMTNFLISQGLSPNVNKILPELLNSSDKIIDVRYDEKTLPLGIWGGRLGSVTLEVFMIELRAIRNRIQSEMGISNEHYDALMEAFVVEEINFLRITLLSMR